MTIRKLRPRCVRGAATGDFLVWLVAAATIAGFVYVLAREPAMQPAGDEEAVAARLAPVGRVTLSAPAAMPETGTAKTSASEAATAPRGTEGEAAAAQQAAPAETAEKEVPAETAEKEAPAETAEKEMAETPTAQARTAAAPARESAPVDTAGERAEAAAVESAPRTQAAPPPVTGAREPQKRPDTAEAGAPESEAGSARAEQVRRRPGPGQIPGAERLPVYPPGGAWGPPAAGWRQPHVPGRMIWIRRDDLPGHPYELRPAMPGGR